MNKLQKKCLKCVNGVRDGGDVRCTHSWHPGIVGGCGTEWVARCSNYRVDLDPRPKRMAYTIIRE